MQFDANETLGHETETRPIHYKNRSRDQDYTTLSIIHECLQFVSYQYSINLTHSFTRPAGVK